jgi:hypothetical protein
MRNNKEQTPHCDTILCLGQSVVRQSAIENATVTSPQRVARNFEALAAVASLSGTAGTVDLENASEVRFQREWHGNAF